MAEWRSINEIARDINIPETTARRYLNTYSDFIKGQRFGAVMKYPHEVAAIIGQIYSLSSKGKKAEEIRDILKGQHEQVITIEPQEQESQNTQETMLQVLSQNRGIIESLKKVIEDNTEALNKIMDQQQQIEELRQEIRHMREMREDKKIPLWQRIFKK